MPFIERVSPIPRLHRMLFLPEQTVIQRARRKHNVLHLETSVCLGRRTRQGAAYTTTTTNGRLRESIVSMWSGCGMATDCLSSCFTRQRCVRSRLSIINAPLLILSINEPFFGRLTPSLACRRLSYRRPLGVNAAF